MESRSLIDLISGIAGGLLLVTAIVLFAVVPQDEPIPPVFQVSYVASETTVPIDQVVSLSENEDVRVPVSLDSAFIYRISFNVEWTDDVVTSEPDTFQFKIFEPEGEQVTEGVRGIRNDPAIANQDNSTGQDVPTGTYTAQPKVYDMEKSLGAPPRDGPVPGETLTETLDEAKARLEADLTTYPVGTWELEVILLDAGDCPSAPPTDPEGNAQATACANETGGANGEDDSNDIRIVSVTYIAYEINIQET